jgi:hypothetical protein
VVALDPDRGRDARREGEVVAGQVALGDLPRAGHVDLQAQPVTGEGGDHGGIVEEGLLLGADQPAHHGEVGRLSLGGPLLDGPDHGDGDADGEQEGQA